MYLTNQGKLMLCILQKIPIGFLKYLKGNDNVEHAILKRGGYKWSMKVNGHRFEAGWVEFVEQHGLKLGNILMFRHEGNMEFEFSIFDSSHCDREYVEYMEEVGDHTREEISKKFKFKGNNIFVVVWRLLCLGDRTLLCC